MTDRPALGAARPVRRGKHQVRSARSVFSGIRSGQRVAGHSTDARPPSGGLASLASRAAYQARKLTVTADSIARSACPAVIIPSAIATNDPIVAAPDQLASVKFSRSKDTNLRS